MSHARLDIHSISTTLRNDEKSCDSSPSPFLVFTVRVTDEFRAQPGETDRGEEVGSKFKKANRKQSREREREQWCVLDCVSLLILLSRVVLAAEWIEGEASLSVYVKNCVTGRLHLLSSDRILPLRKGKTLSFPGVEIFEGLTKGKIERLGDDGGCEEFSCRIKLRSECARVCL